MVALPAYLSLTTADEIDRAFTERRIE